MTQVISIRIESDLKAAVDACADAAGLSLNGYVVRELTTAALRDLDTAHHTLEQRAAMLQKATKGKRQ